jgi:phosphate/sulfate permease
VWCGLHEKAGLGAIDWSGLGITTAAIVFSPLLGFALALLLVLTVSWVFVRSTPVKVDNLFRIRSVKGRHGSLELCDHCGTRAVIELLTRSRSVRIERLHSLGQYRVVVSH